MISALGGLGALGTFGDVLKAKIRPGRWHRVAVAVKCADAKKKGEMSTWIDAVPVASLKSEHIARNGRFAIDPSSFFVFSSGKVPKSPYTCTESGAVAGRMQRGGECGSSA